MNWKKKIKKTKLIREHINILNGLLQLPPRHLDVLALLMKIDLDWKPIMSTDYKNVISTDSRRYIMSETLINKNNLSKYISDLRAKNLIVVNNQGGSEILPSIFPNTSIDDEGNEIAEINFILELDYEE